MRMLFITYLIGKRYQKNGILTKNPNNERLLEGFKRELVSKEWQANRWHEIINSIISM